jgi:integrase
MGCVRFLFKGDQEQCFRYSLIYLSRKKLCALKTKMRPAICGFCWYDRTSGHPFRFNAGATIKVRSDAGSRGANLAKRIMSEVEVGLLIRAAPSKRDRVLLEVIYAGGLRVSETVALTWADVLSRDDRVQLSILGKRAARCARCSCQTSSAARSCPCAATPAPTIPSSPAEKAAN